jgi:hypothetical protein
LDTADGYRPFTHERLVGRAIAGHRRLRPLPTVGSSGAAPLPRASFPGSLLRERRSARRAALPDFRAAVPEVRTLRSGHLLDEVNGRGATGEVWRGRARDGVDGRGGQGAPSGAGSRSGNPAWFLRERVVLTGLDHPNLARVRDLVADGVLSSSTANTTEP